MAACFQERLTLPSRSRHNAVPTVYGLRGGQSRRKILHGTTGCVTSQDDQGEERKQADTRYHTDATAALRPGDEMGCCCSGPM